MSHLRVRTRPESSSKSPDSWDALGGFTPGLQQPEDQEQQRLWRVWKQQQRNKDKGKSVSREGAEGSKEGREVKEGEEKKKKEGEEGDTASCQNGVGEESSERALNSEKQKPRGISETSKAGQKEDKGGNGVVYERLSLKRKAAEQDTEELLTQLEAMSLARAPAAASPAGQLALQPAGQGQLASQPPAKLQRPGPRRADVSGKQDGAAANQKGSAQTSPGTLWGWGRQLHGDPRKWPLVFEGCQQLIGPDPRAMRPQTNLGTCTLRPSKGRGKLTWVSTTVKKGECLWSISRSLTGSGAHWKDLVHANQHLFKKARLDLTAIDNSQFVIQPGWKLNMPVAPQ